MAELHLKRSGETLTVTFVEHQSRVPWSEIARNEQTAQRIYEDAGAYGRTLFEQITRDEALRSALLTLPANTRLTLHIDDPAVALIPWEYLRTPSDHLLAAHLNLVRYVEGLHRPLPDTTQALSIVAVPVSPIDEIHPLDTEREWRRLTEAVSTPQKVLSLLRVRPPTLTQLEETLPGGGLSIVHFMGHSGIAGGKSVLEFEDQLGRSWPIDASYFADALNEHVLLVILNSCLSAVAIPTEFGNIARAVVSQGVPYALGMQFVLLDEAALEISKMLYQHLLQGRSIEEAVRRVRRAVEQNTTLHHPQWIAGIPVLYTHLREPVPAIHLQTGHATIFPDPDQLQETCDLTALPQALHFVGRSQEISAALEVLLKPAARGFVLLHGLGGIGKTALSYAIAARASWFYRDRMLAVSFETFATQESGQPVVVSEPFAERFYTRLARFYGLDPNQYVTMRDLQDAILQYRVRSRSLLVLDNMETLIDAQKQGDATAQTVATFFSRLQEGDGAILLTSRSEPPADWGSCVTIPISGLSEEASAEMFLTLLPADRRPSAANALSRQALARRVQGHPLSLRLLAGRFAVSTCDLTAFLSQIEEELKRAEQTTPSSLEDPKRQRTLYACMEYSVTRLTSEQMQVLHACSLFLAPFLREFVSRILEDETEQTALRLQELVRLGLLERKTRSFPEGSAELLEMHPMLRWYIQERFSDVPAEWRQQYGGIYEQLARQAQQFEGGYDQSAWMRFLIRQSLPDCEAALGYLASTERSSLAYHLAKPYERMGQNRRALTLYELALELDQAAGDVLSIAVTQHAMADVLKQQGKPQEALALYEESLHTKKELGDIRGVAVTQHAMADVLKQQGKPQEALALYEESLRVYQKVGDVLSIAATQHAMADVLKQQGKPQEALALYEESLRTSKELSDIRGVAVTQHAMADILKQQGKPQEALALYEESLHTKKELGDIRGVAVTQHAMADMLKQQGKLQEALALYDKSLRVYQEVGDVLSIAVTQHAMADVLKQQGKPQEALALYEESLRTSKELSDIRGVAVTQHAMADILKQQGKPQEALTLYEESLHTKKELGDIRGVAVTQHAMADVLKQQGKPQEALALYEESLRTDKELGDIRGVAVTEANLAQLLFELGEYNQGLVFVWDAYTQLQAHGYLYDTQAVQDILVFLKETYFSPFTLSWTQQINAEQPDWLLRVQEAPSSPQSSLSVEQRHIIRENTIVVMTKMSEQRAQWHQVLSDSLHQAQESKLTHEAEFFTVLLSLLDGQPAVLPPDHPYAEDLAAVEQGIAAAQAREALPDTVRLAEEVIQIMRDFLITQNWEGTHQILVQQQAHLLQPKVEEFFQQQIALAEHAGEHQTAEMLLLHLDLLRDAKSEGIESAFTRFMQKVTPPFDAELVTRSHAALHGAPAERMAHMQYLTTLAAQTTDEGMKRLIEAIQLALLGGDLLQVGQNLDGIYRQAWEAVIGEDDAEE